MKQAEKILTIGDEVYHYTSGYYTDNRWLDNDTLVLARSKEPDKNYNELVKYTLSNGKTEVICNDMRGSFNYVVWESLIYYTDRRVIKVIDTKTNETRLVYEKDFDDIEGFDMPSITNDGKTMCIYGCNDDVGGFFATIDIESGKRRAAFKKKFAPPFITANHGMICPTNPDRIFFAHEGITFYVSNRLWVYDAREDRAWNIAKQNLDEDGSLGDCFGHEAWAPDGKGMYFVKYPCSPKGPRGVSYVDIETGRIDVLYSKYNYWHACPSRDSRFITADTTDTGTTRSEVVVIDRSDDTETIIDTPEISWNHPCHPHPQMSPDNSKVVYTALDDKGRTCARVAYLK